MPATFSFNTDCSGVTFTFPTPPSATDFTSLLNANGYFAGGLITQAFATSTQDSNKGYYNISTKTWVRPQEYIKTLATEQGSTGTTSLLYKPSTGAGTDVTITSENLPEIDAQRTNDAQLLTQLSGEYCFYKVRYNTLLTRFLAIIIPGSQSADLPIYLDALIKINQRMNAFILLVKHTLWICA